MNALTLLVDAANAESSASEPQGRGMNNKTLSNTIATNQQTEDGGAVRKGILGAAGTENGKNHSALMAAVTSTSMVAAMAAAREQAMLQQLQQQQQEQRDQFAKERFRAAANAQRMLQRELEHREMEQKQQQQQHQHHAATAAAALQQATLLRLMSGGGGIVRTSSPQLHGTALSSAASAMSGIANHGHPRQDAEYLQQLRLEALVQQRRQDTFAKLALAQELAGGAAPSATPAAASSSQSNGNGNTAGNGVPTASSLMTEASKQTAAAKYQRQDAALQKAILMARADEELRNRHQQQQHHQQQQQQQERRMLQEQQKEREQQQQEDEQRLRQAVLLKLAASSTAATSNANANTAAVLNALRNVAAAAAATHAEAPTSAAGRNQRGVEESVMLKFLEEREKQRLLQLAHSQQSFAPRAVPSSVLSSSPPPAPLSSSSSSSLALQQQLQQQIIAQHQQQGNKNVSGSERTDLIGSVFAKVAAAAAANRDPSILREVSGSSSSSAPAPSSDPPTATRSMVFSAIAAAEEQEKQQKQILHLTQQQQQEQQGQRQRHVMDTLSHHQQQLQQHAGLARQQAAVVAHSQRDPVANGNVMEPQQPKSKQLPQSQPSVEQDASFHDSQSMILPCRARGMPMDHNIKTAYFVIPENIKHGTELLCSYFACRNAGIKFRYCVHCKLPVAKRNFAKRHRHSGSKIIAESDDLVPKETASSNNSNGMQTDSGGDDDHTMSSEQGSHQQNQKPEQEEEKGNEEHITKDQKPAETVSMIGVSLSSEKIGSPPTTIVTSCNKISGTGDESGSNYNCCQVESLTAAPLVKPNDSLKDILVCSTPSSNKHGEKEDQKEQEPSEPSLSESIPTQLTITTTERQKAWGDLLSKRPRSEQHNSNAMLQWIQEVLRVSDLENTIEGNDDPEANKSTFEKDSIINKQEKSTVNPKSLTTESCRKRLLPPKKSKMKLLLSRKEDEEMNASETNGTNIRHHGTRGPGDNEDSEDVMGKTATYEDDFPDDASTSSEDSVDLRVRKKGRSK